MNRFQRLINRYQYGWIVGSYIIICVLVVLFGFQNVRKMVEEYNREQAELVTALLTENVNVGLDNIVAQVEGVAEAVLMSNTDKKEKLRSLNNYREMSPFDSIGYLDSSFNFLGDAVLKNDLIKNGLAQKAVKESTTFITDPYRSTSTGEYILTIFVPVFSGEDRIGTVYANLDLDQIAEYALKNESHLPARICMVNAKSLNYIACTDMEDVPADSWYSLMLKMEDMEFETDGDRDEFREQLKSAAGAGTLCFSVKGKRYTLGYSSIENMPNWYIALELENDELSDAFTRFRSIIYMYMIVLLVITVLYTIGVVAGELIKRRNFQKLATLDAMTGIYNKRTFETLVKEYMTVGAGRLSGTLIFMDVDDFKRYNDEYGHLNGDTVLRTFASCIREYFEDAGYLGRYGGDEFVIFIKDGYDTSYIEERIDAIRDAMSKIELEGYGKVRASFSAGGACYPADAVDYEELCDLADKALYMVKESGKGKLYWYR